MSLEKIGVFFEGYLRGFINKKYCGFLGKG